MRDGQFLRRTINCSKLFFTCFLMREPFIWSQTAGSRELLAMALAWERALDKNIEIINHKVDHIEGQFMYLLFLILVIFI